MGREIDLGKQFTDTEKALTAARAVLEEAKLEVAKLEGQRELLMALVQQVNAAPEEQANGAVPAPQNRAGRRRAAAAKGPDASVQ